MSSGQQPPAGGDTTNTVPGLVGVAFLFTIAVGTYIVRIFTRVRQNFRLTTPDYVVSAALVGVHLRSLVRLMLISVTAMRIDRFDFSVVSYRVRLGTLQLLPYTGCHGEDPEVSVPLGIVQLLGIFPRQNIHRGHACSFRNLRYLASGAVGFDLDPGCHANCVRHLSTPPVPPNTCHVGACS